MVWHKPKLHVKIQSMALDEGNIKIQMWRKRKDLVRITGTVVFSQGKRHFVDTWKMSKRQLTGEGSREELVDLEQVRVKHLARSSWTWGERWKVVWELNNCCCCLVAQLCLTLCNPWTAACQVPLPMGFSRKECWSGLPFPPPGELPDPGVEPTLPVSPTLAGRFFTIEPTVNFVN